MSHGHQFAHADDHIHWLPSCASWVVTLSRSRCTWHPTRFFASTHMSRVTDALFEWLRPFDLWHFRCAVSQRHAPMDMPFVASGCAFANWRRRAGRLVQTHPIRQRFDPDATLRLSCFACGAGHPHLHVPTFTSDAPLAASITASTTTIQQYDFLFPQHAKPGNHSGAWNVFSSKTRVCGAAPDTHLSVIRRLFASYHTSFGCR